MYIAVITSLVWGLLMVNNVKSQDACTIAKLALASSTQCLDALESVTGIADFANSSLCTEPCYSLVNNVATHCEQFVSYITLSTYEYVVYVFNN